MKHLLLAAALLCSSIVFGQCTGIRATHNNTFANSYKLLITVANNTDKPFTPKSFTIEAYNQNEKYLGKHTEKQDPKFTPTLKPREVLTFAIICPYGTDDIKFVSVL